MKTRLISTLAHTVAAAVLVIMPLQQAHSAPGTLPTSPLFLSTIVEPNVFFTLDDSGSMSYDSVIDKNVGGIAVTAESLSIFNNAIRYVHHPWYWNPQVIPPVNAYPEAWVMKNSTANKLYYNPDIDYAPWVGTDASGNPLYKAETNFVKARLFPNSTAWITTLTDTFNFNDGFRTGTVYLPTYYEWVDTDGDGVIHATNDSGVAVVIEPGRNSYPSGRNYEDEMKNFANWFTFYRSREYATKAAIGRVINNSDATRMGLDLFNKGHQIDAATMTSAANKLALLDTFYKSVSSGTTPARSALKRVGDRFADSDKTPIVSQAKGGECQQNFNIFMTDGYWNGDSPDVGNVDEDTSDVANNGFDGDANESIDNGYYEDSYSNTLADVAMYYYENDLSDLPNRVRKVPGIDLADHQHLVTYAVSFGVTGELDYSTVNPTDSGFAWTDPFSANADDALNHRIDDLWHASYNSRGKFLFAQNSSELQAALEVAIADVSERTGTAAAVAVNSAQLSTESVVYLAQFNTNRWQGNLTAFPVDIDTGNLSTEKKWDAAGKLLNRVNAGTPRQIITYDSETSTGIPFQWDDLSTAMQNDLKVNLAGGSDSDTIGEARLDYLRGDRTNEGAGFGFRERISLLGDLVNSGPVFVGPPNLAWPDTEPFPEDGEAYSAFKNSGAKSRKKIVYVGANDGMLHAFNDDSGEEEFGYIPGMTYSQTVNKGLHYLTNPAYGHNYYVDLTPTLSDVYIASDGSPEWHTVLIGGMRGGGRGLYALDVTDPGSFVEANAANLSLWEFTSDDDADIGYSYSRPAIAFTNAGTWVAIFGNGYNDTGSGESTLFIVDIEKGADGTWDAGDYKKISTKVGTTGDPNGMATPALADIDGNGTVDRVYAGDIRGNMWVFDLSSTNATSWGSAYKDGDGTTPKPLFKTETKQPITAKPVLASHPTQPDSTSNKPNIMVYFGTGQYLVKADMTTDDSQSFYGVWDKDDGELDSSDLIEQTYDDSFGEGRFLTRNAVDYSTDHGWHFALPDSGERAVTSPVARGDAVFFNTYVPQEDPCASGGYGYKFAVDLSTGGSPLTPTIDSNNDNEVDEDDIQSNGSTESTLAAVKQEGFLPEPVFIEDLAFTAEVSTKVKKLAKVPAGRFSWQELIQ